MPELRTVTEGLSRQLFYLRLFSISDSGAASGRNQAAHESPCGGKGHSDCCEVMARSERSAGQQSCGPVVLTDLQGKACAAKEASPMS
jgi:hypothetical protein